MLFGLFPQNGKDIPAITAITGLSTNTNVTLTDPSKTPGGPGSIGRCTIAILASYISSIIGFLSTSASAGIGYATGAGGAVTQGTSRTTAVELNTVCGAITLFSAAGSATPFSFTLTNSRIAATDTIILSQKSGTDLYTTQVITAVGAGSCRITLANAAGTTVETPVFNFAVIKAVAA